jgi:hypothetical protein
VPTKRASAVALEAFTEAALAARRHPRRRVLLGLALSALRDDPADVLGLLAAHRDLATAGGGRRRWLALPPPDPGVLHSAVEDDPGVVVVVLRGLRWRLSRQVVPRLGPRHALAAGEGWDRTAGPQLGLSARQRAHEQAARRLLRWDPHDALGDPEVAKDTWPLQVLRLPLRVGEVVCEVEESELLVRLHELGTNGRFSNAILPAQRPFLIIDITAAAQALRWIQAKSDCRLHGAAATVTGRRVMPAPTRGRIAADEPCQPRAQERTSTSRPRNTRRPTGLGGVCAEGIPTDHEQQARRPGVGPAPPGSPAPGPAGR